MKSIDYRYRYNDGKYTWSYLASFESPYELFLYKLGAQDYDDSGFRQYSLGAVVNGICTQVSGSNPCDTVCASYSIGKLNNSTGAFIKSDYGYGERTIESTCSFKVYSEDDYDCSGNVFDSIAAAQVFYDIGFSKYPLNQNFDDMPDFIKELYLIDNIPKSVCISFPNGERDDIVGSSIIEQSFSFTESICSRRSLKFGLCESSVVQFECVDIEDIEGCEIEVLLEIDISSLSADIVKEYGSIAKHHLHPYFCMKYGRFKVDSCKLQSDMNRRIVIAYSDTINSREILVSPFEKAKMETKFASNTAYTYNPAHFAISNVSQNVNLSLDSMDFQVFNGITTLKGELKQAEYSPALYNSYNPNLGEDIGVRMTVDVMQWDLLKYINYGLLMAYKMGDKVTAAEAVATAFREFTEPYKDRITGYESNIENVVQVILDSCHPFGYIQNYSKKQNNYIPYLFFGMKDNGFFAPKFPGYGGNSYGLYIPYRVTFEIRQLSGSTTNTIKTFTYDLCDSNGIDVVNVHNSLVGKDRLFIPVTSGTVTRSKTPTGEYVLDTSQFPYTMDVFRALLELNACFLKSDKNNVYSFHFLNGNYGIYPGTDLFPGADLFPSYPSHIINPSEYIEAWHSEEMVEPYTAIMANYVDADGNECSAEYHEAEYVESREELLSQTYTKTSTTYSIDEVYFDLTTTNPFTNGATVYVMCEGLTIDSVSVKSGGDNLFDIPVEAGSSIVEYTADNWESATRIEICFDMGSAAVGSSFNIVVGEVTKEEVGGKQYNTLDLSSNYLIQNYAFSETELLELMENLLLMIGDVSYMPTDIELIGMPWIKAGDRICVNTYDGTINTYVLRRTMKGILSLIDNYESR